MNAICLVIDRLHAGFLGAYGNAWVQTPQLDRLAAESFVFDHALADSPRLEAWCRSCWHGWHAIRRNPPPEDRPTLLDLLDSAGVSAALVTDEPAVARHPLATGFDELVEIDPPEHREPAHRVEQTHVARCFAQTIDWLQEAREARGPLLLWCHLTGLGGPWDAPREFRRAYVEEGDPPPRNTAEVPRMRLAEDYDPDELLWVTQAYAGQVSLLDTCVGALLEFLDESPMGAETLLVLLSARGFPLGEHLRVGSCDEALYGELVQVPWMMRFPDGLGAAARSQALVEPGDLWATLLAWWQIAGRPDAPTAQSLLPVVREEVATLRDRLLVVADGLEQAIRTPAWYLRESGGAEEDTAGVELFAKPDDRWEVNDVSDRCHEVVDGLREVFVQSERFLQTGQMSDLPPLEEILASWAE